MFMFLYNIVIYNNIMRMQYHMVCTKWIVQLEQFILRYETAIMINNNNIT